MPVQASVPRASSRASDTFIVTTSLAGIKPDANSRKVIRSHVMKGRNRRREASSYPSDAHPDAAAAPVGSWLNGDHDPEHASKVRASHLLVPLHANTESASLRRYPQVTASSFGSIPFAIDMEPYMLELLSDLNSVMDKSASTIGRCMELGPDSAAFDSLRYDAAYVHSLLFLSQSYFDLIKAQSGSHRAILHMTKAINLLREKLQHPETAGSLASIFTVLSLCLVADASENFELAQKHLRGLYHLVTHYYGSIAAFAERRALQLKCCRLDVLLALKIGSRPLFFTDTSWKAYLPVGTKELRGTPLHRFCSIPDARLVNAWTDMREFCKAVNLALQSNLKVEGGLIAEILISVLYRLQLLEYRRMDEHEVLRLVMLAFSTTVFLEDFGLEVKYKFLANKLRAMLLSRDYGDGKQDGQRLGYELWLLFVVRVSILNQPEDHRWLLGRQVELRQRLQLSTWPRVKDVLKGYLWVDMVHDRIGREFFYTKGDVAGIESVWTQPPVINQIAPHGAWQAGTWSKPADL